MCFKITVVIFECPLCSSLQKYVHQAIVSMVESANPLATRQLVFVSLALLDSDAKRRKVIILLALFYAFSVVKNPRQTRVGEYFCWIS